MEFKVLLFPNWKEATGMLHYQLISQNDEQKKDLCLVKANKKNQSTKCEILSLN